jgi:hypothetical protein
MAHDFQFERGESFGEWLHKEMLVDHQGANLGLAEEERISPASGPPANVQEENDIGAGGIWLSSRPSGKTVGLLGTDMLSPTSAVERLQWGHSTIEPSNSEGNSM